MKNNQKIRLYNVLFPVWLLIWFPSWLWLLLIPLNYLVDWLVTVLSFRRYGVADYRKKARRQSWRICIIGFLADFAGALLLVFGSMLGNVLPWWEDHISTPIGMNPFADLFGLLFTVLAIALSGILIYVLDRWILKRDSSLTPDQVRKTARNLAMLTAPYLFLIPTVLIYR